MEITPIGVLCILASVLIIARPLGLGLVVFGLFLPLQTAAAFNLWAVGGLSVIGSHVLIGALVAAFALRPRLAVAIIRDSAKRPATILLGLFVVYGILSAFFMPRLFEGFTHVYSLERTAEGVYGIPLVNLHPRAGNITQSFYVTTNFLLFAVMAFIIGRRKNLLQAALMLNAITAVHVIFGLLSVMPNFGPAAAVLDFVRTANYSILSHHTVAGMRRVIGSYAEASAFGAMSIGLFSWNFLRFLQTRGLWYLIASLLTLTCVIVSFSTTAYAVMSLLIMIWSLHTIYKLVRSGLSADQLTALFTSAFAFGLVIVMLFFEPARVLAAELYERLFGAKLQSESGLERASWNIQGLRNFMDTNGLGVGLGSARTSSLATVLLSNVGALGALLYAAFLWKSFLRPWRRVMPAREQTEAVLNRRIFVAARAGALAMLLSHLIAGGNVDSGLLFFVFAAIAAGAYLPRERRMGDLIIERPSGAAPRLWFAPAPPGGEIQYPHLRVSTPAGHDPA